MPRNGSGQYTLPSGGGVVTAGTTIEAAWANALTADLATEIQSSLDRAGRGPMLAPLKATDGTVAAPALTFDNEPASGLYRIGAGAIGMAVGGALITRWAADRVGVGLAGAASARFHVGFDGASINGLRIDDTAVGGTPFLIDARKNSSQLFYVDYSGQCAAIQFTASKAAGGVTFAASNTIDADIHVGLTVPGAAQKFAYIRTYSAVPLYFGTADVNRWGIDNAGHFLPQTDNAQQVGSVGNRLSHLYSVNVIATTFTGSMSASLSIGSGLTASGSYNGSTARTVSIASDSNGYGVRTVSTSNPSGTPAAGDMWLKREA